MGKYSFFRSKYLTSRKANRLNKAIRKAVIEGLRRKFFVAGTWQGEFSGRFNHIYVVANLQEDPKKGLVVHREERDGRKMGREYMMEWDDILSNMTRAGADLHTVIAWNTLLEWGKGDYDKVRTLVTSMVKYYKEMSEKAWEAAKPEFNTDYMMEFSEDRWTEKLMAQSQDFEEKLDFAGEVRERLDFWNGVMAVANKYA